ncbi:MAG: reprolysin-like metallopeptidase [Bacteroidota bacterium]
MIRTLLFALCCSAGLSLFAQESAFRTLSLSPELTAEEGQFAELDLDRLRGELAQAPREFSSAKSNTQVRLPLPDGSFADFTVYNSPVLEGHQAINSYRLVSAWGAGRLAASWKGVSGVLQGPGGFFVIEPSEDGYYRISTYRDFMALTEEAEGPLACGFDEQHLPDYGELELAPEWKEGGASAGAKSGNEARELRVYDLIMTNTGEFAQNVGGDTMDVLEAFNTVVSTINGIYENEIGIRINLIEVPGLIYLDPDTDPFAGAAEGSGLLGQVIGAFEANAVPAASYDLGHILTGGCNDVGGVVSGRACTAGKTRGVTCVRNSLVGAALRIMAHEVAHQFAVSHSWNNCPGSDNQRAGSTAFEPGAGNTIMSYAGTCGAENVGAGAAYYHSASIEQFLNYTRETGGRECATVIETDNLTPQVELDYTPDFYIPISTPFRLEGTATDANGDDLTYNWEQFDLGPASEIRDPEGNAPLFVSVPPTEDGNVRYFPRLDRITNNISSLAEVLPTYSRDLTFRLTARDNNPEAGGVDWEEIQFFSTNQAGPFVVNEPDAGSWQVGDYQRISWEVAGTDQGLVNCKRVNVVLSTDGGQTFDVVLAENVPNVGNAFVTVPEAAITETARIMVEAADNVFLNVNAQPFPVTAATQPTFTLEADTRYDEVCLPEVLTVEFSSGSILDFAAPINLSLDETQLPAGVTGIFSTTTVVPGGNSVLTLDLSDTRFAGRLELSVIAAAEGVDTTRRRIILDVTDNDYSDLFTAAPVEGSNNIILTTAFDWTDAANAATYAIQIATSPTFADTTIFEEAFNLTETAYEPDAFFAANTLYFWRVRPTNACGDGPWLDPNSFRTVNSQCNRYDSEDTPVPMPGTGPSFTRESSIFIEDQGTISDVNIPIVNVRYNFVSKITLTLVSPAGTRVTLYQENCQVSTNRIELGFDDEAPNDPSCPTTGERVFIPVGDLSDFNGEDTFGEWTMEVAVSETGGSAGSFENWSIEFCADLNAAPIQRITNVATEVPPLQKDVITGDNLNVRSDVFDTGGTVYTITALPTEGRLLLYRNELSVGDQFGQDDINGLGLFYENTSGEEGTDDFGFVVTTPDGGYLPVEHHNIIIDDDALVSNRTVSPLEESLRVFPNPVGDVLHIRWLAAVNRDLHVELFDLNGRLLQQRLVDAVARATELRTEDLPAGIYLLRVDGAVRRIVKR